MSKTPDQTSADLPSAPAPQPRDADPGAATAPKETGGPKGKDPTRYGDWENKGRCIDF